MATSLWCAHSCLERCFFKLCAMNVGRFVRAYECIVDRARLDFARIFISTSQLEILNTTSDFIIDGSLYSIKLVEEWGCNLGEDAFFIEVEYDSRLEALPHSNNVDGMEEVRWEWELDDLVNDLHKEWSADERKNEGKHPEVDEVEVLNVTKEVNSESCKKQENTARTVLEPVNFHDDNDAHLNNDDMQQVGSQARSLYSGPWSLDWLPNKTKEVGDNATTTSKIFSGDVQLNKARSENVVQQLQALCWIFKTNCLYVVC